MAIDMISEAPSLVTSPRISFSDDLSHKDSAAAAIQDFQNPLDSNSDFDFCINNTETTSADELFLNGLILPLQLQEKFVTSSKTQDLASPPSPNQEILKQVVSTTSVQEQEQVKNQSKSFWRIRRSTSLHCVNSHKKSSFWSLPLLSRSNSTGSVPNSSKQSTKEGQKCKQMKNHPSPAANFYTFPSSQKPPLRKNYGGLNNYGNGVRINPVLNVPPTFIPKGTANLFGLGSFFANGKEKKSKK